MDKLAQNMRLPQKGLMGWFSTKFLEKFNRSLEFKAVKLCELKPDHQILEVGFGPGLGLEAAYKQIKDGSGKVWGLDISPYMLEVAGNRLKNAIDSGKVELCLGSVMEIPFEANTFDRVFHCNCFYFWPDFNQSAQEIYRVMKPESLMVTTINQAGLKKGIKLGMLKYGKPDVPLYMEALSKNGFSNVYLKQFDGPGKVFGLDISPNMHEVAGNCLKNAIDSGKVELCLGSVMEIPFEANTFDRVFHSNCFYYWPDFNKGAQEIYQVMKPGSLMVIAVNQNTLQKAIWLEFLKYGNPDVPLYMETLSKNSFSNVHLKEFDEHGKVYQAIFASVSKK